MNGILTGFFGAIVRETPGSAAHRQAEGPAVTGGRGTAAVTAMTFVIALGRSPSTPSARWAYRSPGRGDDQRQSHRRGLDRSPPDTAVAQASADEHRRQQAGSSGAVAGEQWREVVAAQTARAASTTTSAATAAARISGAMSSFVETPTSSPGRQPPQRPFLQLPQDLAPDVPTQAVSLSWAPASRASPRGAGSPLRDGLISPNLVASGVPRRDRGIQQFTGPITITSFSRADLLHDRRCALSRRRTPLPHRLRRPRAGHDTCRVHTA